MSAIKLAVVVAGMVLGLWSISAQQAEPPLPPFDLPLVPPQAVPETGTFWSAQRADEWPPLPFNPVADFEVPVYSLGGGNSYLYDDRLIDYEALEAEVAAARLLTSLAMNSSELPEFPGEGEEGGGEWTNNYVPIVYGSNDLWLELVSGSVTNGMADLIIHNPQDLTNSPVWDLYATTNLNVEWPGLNGTNWTWLLRTAPGQTNVTASALSALECYYRLGGTNDTDGDMLTDAYEALVSHSDPGEMDTDGDGMTDYYEWIHFGTMSQGAGDDFDGDGAGNLDELNAALNPSVGDTDGDGRIDELFRVRIRSPQ